MFSDTTNSPLEDIGTAVAQKMEAAVVDPFPGHSTNFDDQKMMPSASHVKSAEESCNDLPDAYRTFIHRSKYARFIDSANRRETWSETVDRYFTFFEKHLAEKNGYTMEPETKTRVRDAILNLRVMPSMRALMTAGPALERDNMAGYNCSAVAVDDPRVFDEILNILMNGTGVGFSCERQFIAKLPKVPSKFTHNSDRVIRISDSKEGWSLGLRHLIDYLYSGIIPVWDLSEVRAAGAVLKTFGGRSSGPKPLNYLFKFTVALFRKAEGRKLTSIEVHDLVCKIAEIVVVGGVRRSALISLSNLSDDRMRTAKSGDWFPTEPQRQLANNSVAYQEKPEIGRFMHEWISLYESKSGERGIFNREACQNHVKRKCPLRDPNHEWLTNPCCEIILRNRGLCNLSEVIVRADDTPETLREKVRIATIIGTWQASLTDFRYVSAIWRENCEREYLLGVSLTGIMDNAFMSGRMKPEVVAADLDTILTRKHDEHVSSGDTFDEVAKVWTTNKKRRCEPDQKVADAYVADYMASPWKGYTLPKFLEELKEIAIETNKFWAHKINIGQSHAITCVKPSGTVSQLVDSASGIHTRHSKFYIRTVRSDTKDPLTAFLKDQGVPWEPNAWKPNDSVVFSFPIKAPDVCVTRDDQTALDQLEICKIYNEHWCQHKVSVTINVKEHEWLQVGSWVYENFDNIGGISFLPHSDHSYKQAPYQECTEEEYLAAVAKMPKINWKELRRYESTDMTTSAKELACTAGGCEL